MIGITVGRVIFDIDGSEYESASDRYYSVDEPPDGEAYVLIELHLVYLEGSEDDSFETHSGNNRLFGGKRLWGGPQYGSGWLPSVDEDGSYFFGQDIFPGAEVSGWIVPKHMPIEHMSEALLQYSGVYFELPDPTEEETETESE